MLLSILSCSQRLMEDDLEVRQPRVSHQDSSRRTGNQHSSLSPTEARRRRRRAEVQVGNNRNSNPNASSSRCNNRAKSSHAQFARKQDIQPTTAGRIPKGHTTEGDKHKVDSRRADSLHNAAHGLQHWHPWSRVLCLSSRGTLHLNTPPVRNRETQVAQHKALRNLCWASSPDLPTTWWIKTWIQRKEEKSTNSFSFWEVQCTGHRDVGFFYRVYIF